MDFAGAARPLSVQGFDQVREFLNTGAAEIWTVLTVETKGCGFLENRRPLILFERHIFHRQTGGVHDASNPAISSPDPGGYAGGIREYDRLQQAIALDRHAALNSASWGIGQVMGFNSAAAGFASVDAMVDAMVESEDAQLRGMATFLRSEKLHEALANRDWSAFAHGYNGADFKKNQYDTRLAASFQQLSHGPLPDLAVRQAQVSLMFLGLNPGDIDGILGKRTRSAIVQFRQQQGLRNSDEIDAGVLAALVGKAEQAARAASV